VQHRAEKQGVLGHTNQKVLRRRANDLAFGANNLRVSAAAGHVTNSGTTYAATAISRMIA
jgi:hypothetical protein